MLFAMFFQSDHISASHTYFNKRCDLKRRTLDENATMESHVYFTSNIVSTSAYIQGDSGGKVNILNRDNVILRNSLYESLSNSESVPRYIPLNLQT
jgi:hypothetical protein